MNQGEEHGRGCSHVANQNRKGKRSDKKGKGIGVRSTLFTIDHGSMGHFFIVDKPFKNMLKP
jgi:signal transduction histidine kinase